jgi:hypothetical protein
MSSFRFAMRTVAKLITRQGAPGSDAWLRTDGRQAFPYKIMEELPVTRLTCASWNFFYSNSYFLQMAFGYDGLCQRRVRGTEVSAHKTSAEGFLRRNDSDEELI